jgi:hypothetical protein
MSTGRRLQRLSSTQCMPPQFRTRSVNRAISKRPSGATGAQSRW